MEKPNSNKNKLDLNRFGLENTRSDSIPNVETLGFGPSGYQPANHNELFAGEKVILLSFLNSYLLFFVFTQFIGLQNEQPWWKSQFFISQPVLFGMWDGVFTSCLINIFGVIVFLRSGWIVAEAGILNAVLIVLCTGMVIFA